MAGAADDPFEVRGTLWLTLKGASFGGAGRIDLLTRIAEYGSINRAAKSMRMSYRAAWEAIDTMNDLAGEALLERQTGGKGGGGTRLTARGRRLIENFRRIETEHRRFIDQLSQQADDLGQDFLLLRRLNMKTSARNQFVGKITAVKKGAVNDEIDLELSGGLEIVAVVTHESTEGLGLKAGAEAFALVKASSIIIVTDDSGARFSARNRISGKVTRVQAGAVNSEVVIETTGGAHIAAIITNESCTALGLAAGKSATALFKASSVILGVPA